MFVILKEKCDELSLVKIISLFKDKKIKYKIHKNKDKIYIEVKSKLDKETIKKIKTIKEVKKILESETSQRLASREFFDNSIKINFDRGLFIGDEKFTIIAGPCSVENQTVTNEIAHFLSELGVSFFRAGAFKPRTSPYTFQGLGEKGLKILKNASEKYNLKIVTESISEETVELVNYYSDIIQIGSRNAQNFYLLKKVGNLNKPILLKRGFMNTLEEFMNSAEYVISEGNENVILCERGIRTFEKATRNTLDISAIPLLKKYSNLPVFVDPSHAAGRTDIIPSLVKASLAAGADGIIVEVHINPKKSKSDSEQSLDFKEFENMFVELKNISKVFNKKIN
jgi:3-deoxy-7-phosphoheptulonate synthase